MKPQRVIILFDSHTPYLAFRVNALQREMVKRGLHGKIELHVVLTAAGWSSYGWGADAVQSHYEVPVHILSKEFHGLGLRSFFHPSIPGILFKLAALFFKLRPRITFVGGYDRPESIFCRLLSYPFFAKVGVMHDSRFNDAESFSKSIIIEFIKSLVVARYSFFMVPGRECADYTRFLAGAKAQVFTEAWNVVDNDAIAKAADDGTHDADICQRLGVEQGSRYFFFPARFTLKKNIPFVLRAYAVFVRGLGDAEKTQFVLCGKGREKEIILQTIAEQSLDQHVKLCEWLPYELMPRACRMSTALILASTHDQWGMTVNESLSAGTPVLVSNRCGAHELVRNNENGFTFSPDDEGHLSALFRQLHEEVTLVARLRKNCALSMACFSIRQFVEKYIEVFECFGLLDRE